MTKHKHEEHENHERWLVSYADFITLLFAFFVIMYSVSSVNEGKFRTVSESIQAALHPVVSKPISHARFDIGDHKASLTPGQPAKPEIVRRMKDAIVKSLKGAGLVGGISISEGISITETDHGVQVSIADSTMFESGRADLRPEAFPILASLAEVLGEPVVQDVKVQGHTDNVPIRSLAFPSNWELSSARAVTVVRTLSEQYGVPAERFSASGFAEFKPLSDNLTPETRAKNRRVELHVTLAGFGHAPGSESSDRVQ